MSRCSSGKDPSRDRLASLLDVERTRAQVLAIDAAPRRFDERVAEDFTAPY
jgi:hypothetical protein